MAGVSAKYLIQLDIKIFHNIPYANLGYGCAAVMDTPRQCRALARHPASRPTAAQPSSQSTEVRHASDGPGGDWISCHSVRRRHGCVPEGAGQAIGPAWGTPCRPPGGGRAPSSSGPRIAGGQRQHQALVATPSSSRMTSSGKVMSAAARFSFRWATDEVPGMRRMLGRRIFEQCPWLVSFEPPQLGLAALRENRHNLYNSYEITNNEIQLC